MFDLIIFDCDGTLTDSEIANNQATVDILAEIDIHYTIEHALTHWVGRSLPNILLGIQMETGKVLPDDILTRYVDRVTYLQNQGMKAIDGAHDLVIAAGKKFKICVASNGERTNVLRSLELTGLMPLFTEATVFTKVQVKNPKPAPDLFLYAADQMGVSPDRCVVIEDSASGVTAGVAAGMTTWGFTGSAHDPQKAMESLKSAGAHDVFTHLIHISDRLGL